MNPKQSLEVIKQVLDAATKGGIFPNMEASFTAANAYNVLFELINKEESKTNASN